MGYKVTFVWYHDLGTDRTYHVNRGQSIRPALIEFLELLHLRRSSIIAFDRESVERAFNEHPELQVRYEQRRQALLRNPRDARFPYIVYQQHVDKAALEREVNRVLRECVPPHKIERSDISFNIVSGEAKKYERGVEESAIVDFPGLERAIREELETYETLLELIKDSKVGYSENLGIFLPPINHIDPEQLTEIDWHVQIGRACMDMNKGMRYIDLETCLNPGWEMKPEDIPPLPLVAYEGEVIPWNRVYVALGSFPQRPKFVRIAFDGHEWEDGNISSYLCKLYQAAWVNFLSKMRWADFRR